MMISREFKVLSFTVRPVTSYFKLSVAQKSKQICDDTSGNHSINLCEPDPIHKPQFAVPGFTVYGVARNKFGEDNGAGSSDLSPKRVQDFRTQFFMQNGLSVGNLSARSSCGSAPPVL
jgi:hypothetical protein